MDKNLKNDERGMKPKNWIGASTVLFIVVSLLVIAITGFVIDWFWMLWGAVVALLCFIIFVLILSATAERFDRRRLRTNKSAVDADAKVLSCIKVEPPLLGKPFIATKYRCIVLLNGDVISTAGRKTSSYENGQKVKVRYLPESPEKCIILD